MNFTVHSGRKPVGAVLLVLVAGLAVGASAAQADTTLMSCTPADFESAVAAGGTVTFAVDCPSLVPSKVTSVPSGKVLDIEGNGHMVALSGNGQRRLFNVSGGQLTVRGVTLRSGFATGASGTPGSRPGCAARTAPEALRAARVRAAAQAARVRPAAPGEWAAPGRQPTAAQC